MKTQSKSVILGIAKVADFRWKMNSGGVSRDLYIFWIFLR